MEAKTASGEAEQENGRREILGNRRTAEQEEEVMEMVGVRIRQRAAATVIEAIGEMRETESGGGFRRTADWVTCGPVW
jgi:hypothetical protein